MFKFKQKAELEDTNYYQEIKSLMNNIKTLDNECQELYNFINSRKEGFFDNYDEINFSALFNQSLEIQDNDLYSTLVDGNIEEQLKTANNFFYAKQPNFDTRVLYKKEYNNRQYELAKDKLEHPYISNEETLIEKQGQLKMYSMLINDKMLEEINNVLLQHYNDLKLAKEQLTEFYQIILSS